jgi:acyl-CoA reductase-like NAD-dependent aldehyde dehydrogenase
MEQTLLLPSVQQFLKDKKKLLINGGWIEPSSGKYHPSTNPATGEVLTHISMADERDVDLAVDAASHALESGAWPKMSPADRGKMLWRIAELIDQYAEELAQIETLDNGKPISISRSTDVQSSSNTFRYFAGWPTKLRGDTNPVSNGNYLNYTVREPVGVVGQIIPWNYPLMMAAWKLAPALAAGNTVILKPAEITSLSALRLGDILLEAGVPSGVVNIVTGRGSVAGSSIANHPKINKVAFTGSTEVGRKIMESGAGNVKRISLELGGKSPNIIFEDADLEAAAEGAAEGIFYNMGQDCTSGSRVFIQRSVYDKVVDKIADYANKLVIGSGLDPRTNIGPIVSKDQLRTVSDYVTIGLNEGASLVAGGRQLTDGEYGAGNFYTPTVFADVHNQMRIAQEEIFGPVVSIIPFDTVEDVIVQANDSIYGLGAGIWTRDIGRAHGVAKALKAGMVWINCYSAVDPAAPFGGYKLSGYGREMGEHAMELYTEVKSVWVKLDR